MHIYDCGRFIVLLYYKAFKLVEYYKQSLRGCPNRIFKDTVTECSGNCVGLAQEVSEGTILTIWLVAIPVIFWQSIWLHALFPRIKNLSKAKLKSNGLISLAEAIS